MGLFRKPSKPNPLLARPATAHSSTSPLPSCPDGQVPNRTASTCDSLTSKAEYANVSASRTATPAASVPPTPRRSQEREKRTWSGRLSRKPSRESLAIHSRCSTPSHSPAPSTRSIVHRGKRLRNQVSRLNLIYGSRHGSEEDLPEPSPPSFCSCDQSQTGICRCSISTPMNFQHLTHAMPQQFTNIIKSSQSDLIADFSAMRAGQFGHRQLRGIQTQDLSSRGSSSTDTATLSLCRSESDSQRASNVPSLDSETSQSSLHSSDASNHSSRISLPRSRSRESFSQPFVNGRAPKPPRTLFNPPPRTSSRAALTQYSAAYQPMNESRDLSAPELVGSEAVDYIDTDIAATTGPDEQSARPASNFSGTPAAQRMEENSPFPNVTTTMMIETIKEDEALMIESTARPRALPPASGRDTPSPDSSRLMVPERSNSQDSSRTIKPTVLVAGIWSNQEETLSYIQDEFIPKKKDPMVILYRSSINNGLFSSWQADESSEDEHGGNDDEEAPPAVELAYSSEATEGESSPCTGLDDGDAPTLPRSRIPVRGSSKLHKWAMDKSGSKPSAAARKADAEDALDITRQRHAQQPVSPRTIPLRYRHVASLDETMLSSA